MKALKDILYKVTINAVVGSTSVSINDIHFDSRNIKKTDLFVAIKGNVVDGHKFIDIAIKNGALGVIRGSHKIFDHKRSSPSPQSKSPLADHIFSLFPFVEVIEMKAGESLIFDTVNRFLQSFKIVKNRNYYG